jgi:hypothetical protein
MERRLKDELEVTGEVLSWRARADVVKECDKVINSLENKFGKGKSMNEIPECEEKKRLRNLLRALGQDVRF